MKTFKYYTHIYNLSIFLLLLLSFFIFSQTSFLYAEEEKTPQTTAEIDEERLLKIERLKSEIKSIKKRLAQEYKQLIKIIKGKRLKIALVQSKIDIAITQQELRGTPFTAIETEAENLIDNINDDLLVAISKQMPSIEQHQLISSAEQERIYTQARSRRKITYDGYGKASYILDLSLQLQLSDLLLSLVQAEISKMLSKLNAE